ncbi:MAG: ATP-binding protein, partial [Gemmatimonadetes bacterium]|nr:ATP-binding protein [Gemmatimonadota bacterium]
IEVSRDNKKTPGMFRVTKEELKKRVLKKYWRTIYTSHPDRDDPVRRQGDDTHLLLRMEKTGAQKRLGHKISVRPDQPALTQLIEHPRIVKSHKELAEKTIKVFANMRFLDLVPDRMRQAAFPGQTILGNGGENLPTVLREICDDPKRKETLAEWTRKLTPMDVRDFEFPIEEVSGRVQLVFREANNRRVSAYGASDGTLRFLAMLAALLGTNPAGLYFFEEIDNGIHPARLNLLMDLIERQTAKHSTQVLTTTHAPTLLTVMNDNTFEKTSVVCRLQDTSEAIIRPVAELPNVRELRQDQGLGRLHESGWMEDALFFIEDYNAAEDGS